MRYLFALVLVLVTTPAGAQWRARPMLVGDADMVAADTAAPVRMHGALVVPARAGAAGLGWLAGGAVTAVAAYHIFPRCDGCEDPGFANLMFGFAAGGTVGAAVLGAGLDLGDGCSYRGRLQTALIGSTVGTLLGFGAAAAVNHPLPLAFATPTGAVTGSMLCRRTR